MDAGSLKFSVNGQAGVRPRGTDESFIGFLSNVAGNAPTVSLSTSDGGLAEMRLQGSPQGSLFKLVNGFGFGTPNDGITIARFGYVGIGTNVDAPPTRLALRGGSAWTSNGWTDSLSMANGEAAGWEANASGQRFGIGQSGSGLYFFRTTSAFGATGSPANYDLMIADSGRIGIGTITPTTRLQIKTAPGDYGFTHTDGAISVGSYVGGSSSGAAGGWLGTLSNNKLFFFANGGQPSMTVDTTGNVGVGTTTPRATLDVAGNAVQNRSSGGLVKAMIHIDRVGGIVRCYNSMNGLSTGNCGITVTRISSGIYRIQFGFAVSDRFVSITPEYSTTCNVNPISCRNAGANFRFFGTDLEVFTFNADNAQDTADAASMIIVY